MAKCASLGRWSSGVHARVHARHGRGGRGWLSRRANGQLALCVLASSIRPPVHQSTSPPVHPIHRLSQPRQRGTPSPPFPSRLLALVASALHRRGGHGGHPVTRPCRSTMKCAIPWAAVRSVSQQFSPPRCDAAPPRGCRRTRPVDRSPRSHRFHHCHWRGRPLP